jgi:peptide/nickel transport system permease protein
LIVGLVMAMAIVVPELSPYGVSEARPSERLRAPDVAHPFGTDRLGRDQLTRAAAGARTSVGAATATLGLSLAIGVGLGLLAGFRGGLADGLVMRLADVALAVPTLVVAIVVAALFGPALLTVVVVATAFNWATYARVTRAIVRQVRHEPFVDAARAIGATPWRIATREVLPHVWGPVTAMATIDVGGLLMTISGLSFLGLGAQPPTPEWGLMLADGRSSFLDMPHLMVFPGAMIFVTVLGANLLGAGLRQRLAGGT